MFRTRTGAYLLFVVGYFLAEMGLPLLGSGVALAALLLYLRSAWLSPEDLDSPLAFFLVSLALAVVFAFTRSYGYTAFAGATALAGLIALWRRRR